MIRDSGEAPYISQKHLKHMLVGLEKLCKSFAEQIQILADGSLTHAELVLHVNTERAKYGLPQQSDILNEAEILGHDEEFYKVLDADIVEIRRYLELCESSLMLAINEWLESGVCEGLVVSPEISRLARDPQSLAQYVTPQGTVCEDLLCSFSEIDDELRRVLQYVEVNAAAIRKLLSRRNKNVPECFWSTHDYENICHLRSPEIGMIIDSTDAIRRCVAAVPKTPILLSALTIP